MALPKPVPGLVIRYEYLWHSESLDGHDEGVKPRPCVILSATPYMDANGDNQIRVLVVPITHTDQGVLNGLPMPAAEAARLGLDNEPQWIACNEYNAFNWPGYDLKDVPGSKPARIYYGKIVGSVYSTIRGRWLFIQSGKKLKAVERD